MNIIKNTKSVGSHRVNDENGFSEYRAPKYVELLKNPFEVIKSYLQTCIGPEYVQALPKDFFNNIFQKYSRKRSFDMSKLTDEDKEYYKCEYSNKIIALNRALYYMISRYTSIISSENKDIDNYARVVNKKFSIQHVIVEDGNKKDFTETFIKYKIFPSIDDYINENNLDTKAKEDIDYILDQLSDLAILSKFLDENTDSFEKFVLRIIRKMHGDNRILYPRSIINYTAFEFAAEGYPYKTVSGRIYSVSDLPRTIQNKLQIHDLYNKNIYAILSFLEDLTFDNKLNGIKLDNLNFETKVLSNAYGIVIALAALAAEKYLNGYYKNSSFLPKPQTFKTEVIL